MSQGSPQGVRGPDAPASAEWLSAFLHSRVASAHAASVRLEPFLIWLDGRDPATVSPAALLDLYGFWRSELGASRMRPTLEVVRDLYEWMGDRDVPGAAHLRGLTDDYLRNQLPRQAVSVPVAAPVRPRLRGGLGDVAAGLGVMAIGVAFVTGGWIVSRPANVTPGGGGFGPVLPLVLGAAAGAVFLLAGYILTLKAARGLGAVSVRAGAIVLAVIGILAVAFCVVGFSGALQMLLQGYLAYALPFTAFGAAGVFGLVTVLGVVVPLAQEHLVRR